MQLEKIGIFKPIKAIHNLLSVDLDLLKKKYPKHNLTEYDQS